MDKREWKRKIYQELWEYLDFDNGYDKATELDVLERIAERTGTSLDYYLAAPDRKRAGKALEEVKLELEKKGT